jgi:hypothetical protein
LLCNRIDLVDLQLSASGARKPPVVAVWLRLPTAPHYALRPTVIPEPVISMFVHMLTMGCVDFQVFNPVVELVTVFVVYDFRFCQGTAKV